MNWLLLIISIATNAAAHILFKTGAMRLAVPDSISKISWQFFWTFITNPYIIWGGINLVIGTICWLGVLSRFPISVAHPALSLSYVMTVISGYYLFNEPITLMQIGGLALIIVGVMCVAKAI